MKSLKIEEYMNSYPMSFTADMSVEEASLLFLKDKQIGGPVIDEHGKLIGFLSENDVLANMIETLYYNEHVANVADLMSTDVLSMKPYDNVIELGQLILKNKPKVYPVIDDEGKLLGTICRNDVLHAIDQQMRANLKATKENAAY